MKKRTVKILVLIAILVGVPLLVFGVFTMFEDSAYEEMMMANITSNSATIVVHKDPTLQVPVGNPIIRLEGTKLLSCSDSENVEPCLSGVKVQNRFAYYELRNLMPTTQYTISWTDTVLGRFADSPSGEAILETGDVDEGAPYIGRVYGKVIDENWVGQEGALVVVRNDSEVIDYPFAAVTSDDGTYNITYTAERQDNFRQDFEAITTDGREVTYTTASFYNKPVADLIVPVAESLGNIFSEAFVQDTEAAGPNSCVSAKFGGIRAQCNDKVPWVEGLDIENCPKNQNYFRLGLIQHDSVTGFYKPDTVILKLYDEAAKEYVKDVKTGEDLVVPNGGYVDEETMVELEIGKKYAIQAFDGERECINNDSPNPWLMFNERKGAEMTNNSDPNFNGATVPPMMTEASLCKKMGENFAIPYEVDAGLMNEAVEKNKMRWGEALITSVNDIENYKKSVINGRNEGMNMILRICYFGSCDIDDGTAYGEAIAQVYQDLLDSGQLPPQGLFVHVGHNEPNNSEFREPRDEAKFIADTMTALDTAGILSQDPDDILVKAIGPNLDLFTRGGEWKGSDEDPSQHLIYTGSDYIEQMMKNSTFEAQAKNIYAWAANDYIASGQNSVVEDITAFSSYLSGKGLSPKIFATEVGRLDEDMDPDFELLRGVIAGLEAEENVEVILLFNSMGANQDPNFDYHAPLWNGEVEIRGLYPNCKLDTFQVPQEGSVSSTHENGTAGSSSSFQSAAASVIGANGAEASEAYGGFDRCIDEDNDPATPKVCKGIGGAEAPPAYADGGMICGGYNCPFYEDEEGDRYPAYWHGWEDGEFTFDYADGYKVPDEKAGYSPGTSSRCSTEELGPDEVASCGIQQKVQRGGQSSDGSAINFYVETGYKAEMEVEYTIHDQDEDDNSEPEFNMPFKGRVGMEVYDTDPDTAPVRVEDEIEWSEWTSGEANGEEVIGANKVVPSESGWTTIYTEKKCEPPSVKSYNGTGSVDISGYTCDLDGDGMGLYSCVGDNCVLQQGDVTSIADNDLCDSTSNSGPNGDECWDIVFADVGNTSSELPGESDTSTVLGSSSIVLPQRGTYKLESTDLQFGDSFVYNFGNDANEIKLYQDRNRNGEFDQDEFLVPTVMDTKVTRVGDAIEFDLKPGVSMISVPFNTNDFNEAVEIFEAIKAQGGYATAIASFNNTGTQPGWKSASLRGERVYGDDYELSPGDAIYLSIQEPMKLKLQGQEFTTPVQQYVREGWNLIAMKGGAESIRASELILSLNDLPGVSVSKVTIWDPKRGRYISYVTGTDGSIYGEDFMLNDTMGIFVLVDEGIGYWTPE